MRRVLVLTVILLGLICAARADERTAALDDETKLSKLITLSMRAASLREVLAKVEADTGVHLLVSREISEDKATVYCRDQPAREVLRALARCFNLAWSPSESTDKKYLRLWADRKYVASMHSREYQDYLSIVSQFDKELTTTAELVRSGSEYAPAQEYIDRLDREEVPEYHRVERRMIATRAPQVGAAVLQYFHLSEKQREELFKGSGVTVSGAEICQEALKKWPDVQSIFYSIERSVAGYMLRCSPKPGRPGSNLMSSAYFDDSAYAKRADSEAKWLETDEALAKDIPPAKSTYGIRLGEGSGAVPGTMSDGLLEVAEAAGTPFVAQYISEYKGGSVNWQENVMVPSPTSAQKAGDRLAELCRQHKFSITRDGGFLLAKSLLWHRLRFREIPEERIKTWQRQIGGLREPTFDAYVDMANMTWEQVRGVIDNQGYWFGLSTLIYLARCEYALRIIGAMPSDQRRWLLSGNDMPVSALTPAQQVNFMQGFEVREKPTFENVSDINWPKTAVLSFQDQGMPVAWLFAVSGMRMIDRELIPVDEPVNGDPSSDEAQAIMKKQMEERMPATIKILADRVAREHPEIKARDVSIYTLRDYAFRYKLGDHDKWCALTCMVKVK